MTKTYQISDPDFWNKINADFQNSGGIYRLFCVNNQNSPISICRLLNIDKDGILYIGKAMSFLDRVIDLKKCLSPDHISGNHECGVRYKKLVKNKFPYDRLWIILTAVENIHIAEKEFLIKYENEFGELPPLNRNS